MAEQTFPSRLCETCGSSLKLLTRVPKLPAQRGDVGFFRCDGCAAVTAIDMSPPSRQTAG
ncbi:MAG TPA: hypothetical protein VFB45_25135 [Pseudolabrys sp.]|nr:hypothetical protein [Pseudolabrys sp.]